MASTYNPGSNFTPTRGFNPGDKHYGKDYAADPDTPIPASEGGTVVYSGYNCRYDANGKK